MALITARFRGRVCCVLLLGLALCSGHSSATPSAAEPPAGELRFVLSSPVEGESYEHPVIVEGYLTVTGGLPPGEVSADRSADRPAGNPAGTPFSWVLTGFHAAGILHTDSDGLFSFVLPLAGFEGELVLLLRADTRGMTARSAVEFTVRAPRTEPELEESAPVAADREPEPTPVVVEPAPAPIVVEIEVDQEPEPPPVVVEPAPAPIVVEPEPEPQPAPEPAPVVVEPEPAPVVEAEAEAAAEPQPEPTQPATPEGVHAEPDIQAVALAASPDERETPPFVTLSSPAAGFHYRTAITIAGHVSARPDGTGVTTEVSALYVRVPQRGERRSLVLLEDDGGFSIDVPTNGLSGPLEIELVVARTDGTEKHLSMEVPDGNIPPGLEIASPLEQEEYGSGIFLRGTVTDPYRGSGYGGIERVSYRLEADALYRGAFRNLAGDLVIDAEGRFDLPIALPALTGRAQLTVEAVATNGNDLSRQIALLEGRSDIPSFDAEALEAGVRVFWDAMPFATSYTLTAADSDPLRPPFTVEGARSGSRIRNLASGHRYTLQLLADTTSAGYESRSHTIDVIPLSPDSLGVRVSGEYEQIQVTWNSIPGSSRFLLMRAAGNGTPRLLATVQDATRYLDRDVRYGTEYSYSVMPADVISVQSSWSSAQTLAISTVRSEVAGVLESAVRNELAVFGDYIVGANGHDGIILIDATDVASPAVAATFPTSDAQDLAVEGHYIYVADGTDGVRVISIINPTFPEELGRRVTTNAVGIEARGDFVFVADGERGFKVLDVSDKRTPLRIASLDGFTAGALALSGPTAAVVGGSELNLIDVSDPESPHVISTLPADDPRSVAFSDGYVYLADGTAGVTIIDATDLAQPTIVGRAAAHEAVRVSVEGDYLYVADSEVGLLILDVSDRANPRPFDVIPADDARNIIVKDGYAYLVRTDEIDIVRSFIFGDSHKIASMIPGGRPYDIVVSGDRALIAARSGGIRVLDVSEPRRLGSDAVIEEWTGSYVRFMVVDSGIVAVAGNGTTVHLLLLEELLAGADAVQPVASIETRMDVTGLSLSAGLLAIATGPDGGCEIYEVSDVGNPRLLTRVNLPAESARLSEALLFLQSDRSIRVVDLSDPSSPAPRSSYSAESTIRDLRVFGEYVVAMTHSGVEVLFCDEDASLQHLCAVAPSHAEDAWLSETRLFVADGYNGLRVFDISDPTAPRQVSVYSDGYVARLAMVGDLVLVTDSTSLDIIEVFVPEWLQ
jgi:hypothetical protein